jgi:aspartate aminotransferase-like enzyme
MISEPTYAYYEAEFIEAFEETRNNLSKIFQTVNDTLLITGASRYAMEIAVTNTIEPHDKVLCIVSGEFGWMMKRMIEAAGGIPVEIQVQSGKAANPQEIEEALEQTPGVKALTVVHCETSTGTMNPIKEIGEIATNHDVLYIVDVISSLGGSDVRTDEWDIDIAIAGSHKCLSAPPGMAALTLNEKVWNIIENRKSPVRSFSFDLRRYKQLWLDNPKMKKRVFHSMAVNLMLALREATREVLEEGLEERFKRHEKMAGTLRVGVEALGLELFPEKQATSNTVSAIKVPKDIDDREWRSLLNHTYNVVVARGLGTLRGKVIRIGHMGESANLLYISPTLWALESSLRRLGWKLSVGVGLAAMEKNIG